MTIGKRDYLRTFGMLDRHKGHRAYKNSFLGYSVLGSKNPSLQDSNVGKLTERKQKMWNAGKRGPNSEKFPSVDAKEAGGGGDKARDLTLKHKK